MKFSANEFLAAKFAHVERGEEDLEDYQVEATDFIDANPFSALFIDTGLGKTIIVLTLIVRLWLRDPWGLKVLIVAPPRVASQGWPDEISAWGHTAFLSHSVIRCDDDEPEVKAAEKQAYQEACEWNSRSEARSIAGKVATLKKEEIRLRRLNKDAVVYTIDIHHLEWLVDKFSIWLPHKRDKRKLVRKIVGWPFRVVVLDESSGYKDHNSNRFKAIAAVRQAGFIDRLIELTATPAAEGYMGIFAQIFLLDLGERFGRLITPFRKKHFDPHPVVKFVWELKEGAKEIIGKIIADIVMVMEARDYIDGLDPIFIPRPMEMTSDEMALYKKLQREMVIEIPVGDEGQTEEIEARNAAALAGKLMQLAAGAVYNDEKVARVVHDHKINDLRELMEELRGEPLLIAYWYKSSRVRLKKAFPKAQEIDAAGKMVGRYGPWNSGKVKHLLIHPASDGHGLNLQYGPGHDVYMFEYPWSYELFYQLWRRLARRGQKLQVRVHMPVVKGTIEERVVKKLKMKEDAQSWLFGFLKRQRKKLMEKKRGA